MDDVEDKPNPNNHTPLCTDRQSSSIQIGKEETLPYKNNDQLLLCTLRFHYHLLLEAKSYTLSFYHLIRFTVSPTQYQCQNKSMCYLHLATWIEQCYSLKSVCCMDNKNRLDSKVINIMKRQYSRSRPVANNI